MEPDIGTPGTATSRSPTNRRRARDPRQLLDEKVTGIAVSIGARVACQARPAEVVSQTVKDLVTGPDPSFADRSAAELNGVQGE